MSLNTSASQTAVGGVNLASKGRRDESLDRCSVSNSPAGLNSSVLISGQQFEPQGSLDRFVSRASITATAEPLPNGVKRSPGAGLALIMAIDEPLSVPQLEAWLRSFGLKPASHSGDPYKRGPNACAQFAAN